MKLNEEQILALTSEGGKYSLDISKLIFGGIILASIMNTDTDTTILLWVGGVITLLFSLIGFLLILFSKKNNKKKFNGRRTFYNKKNNSKIKQ